MTTTTKTPNTAEKPSGFLGFLKTSYKTGMEAAEGLQSASIEIPLGMLEVVGVPKDKTDVLRNKNKQLVHGMIGGIESIASVFVNTGAKQVGLAAEAVRGNKPKTKKAS
jgi:hypothetical protein